MQLFGALVLLLTASTACGLKCYSCIVGDNSDSCKETQTCVLGLDRCFTLKTSGIITKGCMSSIACKGPVVCCAKDLCNSAIPTGPSVILLLVSSAIIKLVF